jgi:hypothetical protein
VKRLGLGFIGCWRAVQENAEALFPAVCFTSFSALIIGKQTPFLAGSVATRKPFIPQ